MHTAKVIVRNPGPVLDNMLKVYLSALFTAELGDDVSHIVEKSDYGEPTPYTVIDMRGLERYCQNCLEAIAVIRETKRQLGLTSHDD